MRVAVVALPWANYKNPSAPVAALGAYLRQAEPSWSVTCHHAHLSVASRIGFDLYNEIARECYWLGEPTSLGVLYPERLEVAIDVIFKLYQGTLFGRDARLPLESTAFAAVFRRLVADLDAQFEQLAEDLSQCDAVGMTASFGQVFANVAVAKKIKAKNPNVKIIFGGSSISSAVGPSLLEVYDHVDYVVQGEGEIPFLQLSRALAGGKEREIRNIPSVITRDTREQCSADGTDLTEMDSMDALPIPDFDDYQKLADRFGIEWQIPIEGSRGCWWDRSKKTGDAKQTCYFCNLNIQWNEYREKSISRVVEEMRSQSERYQRKTFFFLDNIIRHKGIEQFALKLRGEDYHLFYEMRANLSAYQLLLLREAGVERVQIGVEAVSTPLLKRMGKGTTTIKNLEAMRNVFELNMGHEGNLIAGFPGSTQEEVDETFRVLSEYAFVYEPLNYAVYRMGRGDTVHRLQAQFPVTNVRNHVAYANVVPDKVRERLQLLELEFDHLPGSQADWSSVRAFMDRWSRLSFDRLLFYRSFGDAITVMDCRGLLAKSFDGVDADLRFLQSLPRGSRLELRGKESEIYLFCMSIRSVAEIEERFTSNEQERAQVHGLLDRWAEARLIFREGRRVLSLAVAENREAAAARIRAQHHADQRLRADQRQGSKRLQILT